MSTIDITAPTMIAWPEPSPSSPAPAARRCAASGLDRSARPSNVVGHAVDATIQCRKTPTSTFTEIAYTKFRTVPHGPSYRASPRLYHGIPPTIKVSTGVFGNVDWIGKVTPVSAASADRSQSRC